MVLNAENLTIQAINPGYQELLKGRKVVGLPISEVFEGKDLDHLTKLLKSATREEQTINSPPMLAGVAADDRVDGRFVHTIVPIADASGTGANRLFIYSESTE
jgi:hypothetical protein